MLDIVEDAVADVPGVHVMQQVPLATRSKNGRFRSGKPAKVDIALARHCRMLGIEVHGGREHASKAVTLCADKRKRRAWSHGALNAGPLIEVLGYDADTDMSAWVAAIKGQLSRYIQEFIEE